MAERTIRRRTSSPRRPQPLGPLPPTATRTVQEVVNLLRDANPSTGTFLDRLRWLLDQGELVRPWIYWENSGEAFSYEYIYGLPDILSFLIPNAEPQNILYTYARQLSYYGFKKTNQLTTRRRGPGLQTPIEGPQTHTHPRFQRDNDDFRTMRRVRRSPTTSPRSPRASGASQNVATAGTWPQNNLPPPQPPVAPQNNPHGYVFPGQPAHPLAGGSVSHPALNQAANAPAPVFHQQLPGLGIQPNFTPQPMPSYHPPPITDTVVDHVVNFLGGAGYSLDQQLGVLAAVQGRLLGGHNHMQHHPPYSSNGGPSD